MTPVRIESSNIIRRLHWLIWFPFLAAGMASGSTITPDAVREEANRFLERSFQGQGEIRIQLGDLPDLGDLAGQDREIRFRPMRPLDRRGPVSLSVEFYADGNRTDRRSLTADVQVFRAIPISTRRIDRHQMIREEDLALEIRDVRTIPGALHTLEEALGMRAVRLLPEGKPITEDRIEPVPVVSRGEKVMVSLRLGSIAITASAIALGDGAVGEQIDVRNERSGKRVTATVVRAGLVRIELIDGAGGWS